MSAENIITTKAALIAAIRAALAGKAEAAGAASEAGASVSTALRAYAAATHADGDDAEEAREALTAMLLAGKVKPGTVKGSGNHFAGFRAMLADGLNIETGKDGKPYTAADAQNYIASDDVKRLKAIKAAISEVVSGASKKLEGETGNGERIARLEAIASTLGCDLGAYWVEYGGTGEGQAQAATG